MPVIFRHKGFRFFFYSNEGNPREPIHVHVVKDGIDAKFWLLPQITIAYNDGFDARTMRELVETIEDRRSDIERAWMNSLVRAISVRFDEDSFWVDLSDGRVLGVPLAWFPRVLHATPAERERVTITTRGLHWEDLDEDISIAGLLAGESDRTGHRKADAAA
jgi:hypothetical protein